VHKLSFSEITTKNWSFEEAVKNYSEAGLDGIGVWRENWKSSSIESYGIEKGLQLIKENNLQVADVCIAGLFTINPEEKVEDAIKAIELAGKLDAGYLLVVSGPLKNLEKDKARKILIDSLRKLIPIAEAQGVKLALEPIHKMYYEDWTFIYTIQEALEIINEIDHPNLGIVIDTYHIWQEENVVERIREAGEAIFGAQISDWREPPKSLFDRLIPGEGIIPLKDILQAIDDTGYNGLYDIEIFSEDL